MALLDPRQSIEGNSQFICRISETNSSTSSFCRNHTSQLFKLNSSCAHAITCTNNETMYISLDKLVSAMYAYYSTGSGTVKY